MNPRAPLDHNVNQPERCRVPGPQYSLANGALNSLLTSLVLGTAIIVGASMSRGAHADDESKKPGSHQVTSFKASEWKGPDLAAYGDRFKAAMQLQEREARKPDWSWHDQDAGEAAVVARRN